MQEEHFLPSDIRKNTRSLSVYHSGHEKCAPAHSYGPAVRDHYLIHYVVNGKGEFISGGNVHSLVKGDLFLIEPARTTTYRASAEEPYEYYWVGFNGTDAALLMRMSGFSRQDPVLSYHKDDKLLIHLKDIMTSSGDPSAGEFAALGHLYLFLSCLISERISSGKKISDTETLLDRAIKYIQGNYSRKITVNDIADFVKTDRSHLFRIFKKELGISPQEYLINFRLSRARELLGKYDLNISQVGYSVGYNDPAQFSRLFKKKFYVTPSKQIREVRND